MSGLSEEHKAARLGKLGASDLAEALAKTKTGFGAGRANMLAQLALERITGIFTEGYTSAAMQNGIDLEPRARAGYTLFTGYEVTQVGWHDHPTLHGSGCSSDGLVEEKYQSGIIEIKCPNPATHFETLETEKIPAKYIIQMQWNMACRPERDFCDFVSFCPSFPPRGQVKIIRVGRDRAHITQLEGDVALFLLELAAKERAGRRLCGLDPVEIAA
jgi:hypothetical protein